MSVAIREIALGDQLMLEELLDACTPGWSDALKPGASGPLAFLADPSAFALGGYVDNDPAGWLWGVHIRQPNGTVASYVHELEVVEPHRRKGVASSLTEAAIALCRRNGSHEVWLVTEADNHSALALYENLGGTRSDGGEVVFAWEF